MELREPRQQTSICENSEKWREARRRQDIIRPLAFQLKATRQEIQRAAILLDRCERTIKVWIERYRAYPVLETLMPGHQVGGTRTPRLPEETRAIMAKLIAEKWLGKQEKISVKELFGEIEDACCKEDAIAPSLRTLRRVLSNLTAFEKARAKKIKGDPRDYLSYHNHHSVAYPYDEIQIDHTLVDLFLNLSDYGLGTKRIWLTLAIDVASRMVFGYYLGLKAPSARSSGLALLQGLLPKQQWVEDVGVSYEAFRAYGIMDPWPISGPVELIKSDNGADFRSKAFYMGCQSLGASVEFRPVGKPHFGAHIERLLGTFMRRVHGIPGTTFSNHVEKGRYPSKDKSFLTLEDFELWFVMEILRYHTTPHEGLNGLTPLQKYQELMEERPRRADLVIEPSSIRTAFLPTVRRTISKQGVRLENRYYKHPRMEELQGHRVTVKYHPSRLDSVWVCLDGRTPSFEGQLIGQARGCRHQDAPLDQWHTVAVKQETKRQEGVAKRLMLQQRRMIETLEVHHRRGRGHLVHVQHKGTPPQTNRGRPTPIQPRRS